MLKVAARPLSLLSPLSPGECSARVAAAISPGDFSLFEPRWDSPGESEFFGWATPSSLHLRCRRSYFRSPLDYLCEVELQPLSDGGTRIVGFTFFHPLGMGIVALAYLLGLVHLVATWVRGSNDLVLGAILVVWTLVIVFQVFAATLKSARFEHFLFSTLDARRQSAPAPDGIGSFG